MVKVTTYMSLFIITDMVNYRKILWHGELGKQTIEAKSVRFWGVDLVPPNKECPKLMRNGYSLLSAILVFFYSRLCLWYGWTIEKGEEDRFTVSLHL